MYFTLLVFISFFNNLNLHCVFLVCFFNQTQGQNKFALHNMEAILHHLPRLQNCLLVALYTPLTLYTVVSSWEYALLFNMRIHDGQTN